MRVFSTLMSWSSEDMCLLKYCAFHLPAVHFVGQQRPILMVLCNSNHQSETKSVCSFKFDNTFQVLYTVLYTVLCNVT